MSAKSTLLKYNVPVHQTSDSRRKLKSHGTLSLNLNLSDMLTRDVLNIILPPRTFNDGGQDLIQYVSTNPATKADVSKLQQQLDKALSEKHVKEVGIDPVRSEIYGQCFDEIIRQVTIDCSARGLLLVKVRDEMRTTISMYQTLYESAITWGMRKAMENEKNKDEMLAENESLKDQVNALRAKNEELILKIKEIEKREEDYRAQKEKEHATETAFLKRQAAQLKTQLEQTLK